MVIDFVFLGTWTRAGELLVLYVSLGQLTRRVAVSINTPTTNWKWSISAIWPFFFLTGSSTATAYLTPAVLARRNLTVAVNITVEKILFSKTSGSLKAIGVQLTTSPTAPSYRVKARKEIVLSGGVIGSAQTLLLSGVGPKAELEQVGIECVQDLPSVGKHLADVSID